MNEDRDGDVDGLTCLVGLGMLVWLWICGGLAGLMLLLRLLEVGGA
jgi:hypothetical protein